VTRPTTPSLPELFLQQVMAGHDAAVKAQSQFLLFLLAELPVETAFAESFDKTRDRQGEGHGDVEALGEAIHGNTEVAFG
jgi:hypothetical protein